MSSQIGFSRRERAAPGHTHTRVGPVAASTTFCLMAMNGSVWGGRLQARGSRRRRVHSSLSSLSSLLLSVRDSPSPARRGHALSSRADNRADAHIRRLCPWDTQFLSFRCHIAIGHDGVRAREDILNIVYIFVFEDVDPVTRSLSGYSRCSQRGVVVVPVLSTSSRDSISLLGVTVSYRAATHAAGAGCLALS
jgi:hypothetical protein